MTARLSSAFLRVVLLLRLLMLIAAAGALIGALLMFWEGGVKVAGALRTLFVSNDDAKTLVGSVMGATDAFLFGVVLLVFAFAITFGFVFDLAGDMRERVPGWMRIDSLTELKRTLIQVIVVYLAVDFATDVAEGDGHLSWPALIMPASIALIAAALRLMSNGHEHGADAARHPAPGHPLRDW